MAEIDDINNLQETLSKMGIEAIYKDKVKKYGTGAHVYIPKEYTDYEVLILIKTKPKTEKVINQTPVLSQISV